jgi:hypothetical protein
MNFLDDNYYFPTTDSTTEYNPLDVLGKDVSSGTPMYEGPNTGAIKIEKTVDENNDEINFVSPFGGVYTGGVKSKDSENQVSRFDGNVNFLKDLNTKSDREKFNDINNFMIAYGNNQKEDGTPAIQFIDQKTQTPISIKTLDEWEKLSPETKNYIYDDVLNIHSKSPYVTMDLSSSGEGKQTLFDIQRNNSFQVARQSEINSIAEKHLGFTIEAANNADAEMINNKDADIDRFGYHKAALNEDGTFRSKQEYDNVIKSRYNTLVSKNYLLNSQSALAYNAYRNALLIEQDQKRINPNYKSDIVLNNQKLNNLIAENPTVFDLVNSLDGRQLAEFNNQFGFQFNSIAENPYVKECQSPECRQLRAKSQEEYNKFLKDNDLLGPNGKYQTPNEVYQKLREGLEDQTYEKTISRIKQVYDDPTKTKAISLKDSYQYLETLSVGGGEVTRNVPIKYDFDLIKGYKDPNFTIPKSIIYYTNVKRKEGTLNEKGLKFSFYVDNNNIENTGFEDEVTVGENKINAIFSADDSSVSGKYLTGVMQYLSDSIKETYNTTNRQKNPKGSVVYREFLQHPDVSDKYEVYTIKFDEGFLDRPEFKKVILGDEEGTSVVTAEGEEIKSSGQRDAILQNFKKNGLTVYVPKDIAQKKFDPSIQRKMALDISPVEAAIEKTGSFTMSFSRSGSIDVVKDETAGLYRISGNYLKLNSEGNYESIPFGETIPFKNEKGTKIPFDIDDLINRRVNAFRYYYNQNTKHISNNIELGIKMSDDVYTRYK